MTNRDWKEIEAELNGLVPQSSTGRDTIVARVTTFAKRSKWTKTFFWRTSLTL